MKDAVFASHDWREIFLDRIIPHARALNDELLLCNDDDGIIDMRATIISWSVTHSLLSLTGSTE